MTIKILQNNVLRLPIEERISFAKLILESIDIEADNSLIDDEIKFLLDKRLSAIENQTGTFYSWEEVKKEARKKTNI